MPHVRSQGDLLLALLRGVDIEVWLDDAGQPNASRSDSGRVNADDIFDLKRAGYCMKNSGAHVRPHCSA